ncbi:hypothetical protein [Nocardiopsis sp. FIRDI 009]|uniref:hypothetical protein n=1 Tax=Nocardiopsis sp. FIRDI 009 TaxID=714197 RepID=UPI000E24398B|nr:hypothetical protein [Nocardiopsis sp. FIRDI 009]
MSTRTRNWFRAAALAVAPVVLLAVILYHPFLAGATLSSDVVAQTAAADATRWALAHLLTVGALALFVLAFQGLRGLLRDAGEQQWSFFAFPLVIVAGVLAAALAGMEVAVAAALPTGASALALMQAVQPWFLTLLAGGSLAFLLGSLAFAAGVLRTQIMDRTMTVVVAAALAVMGLAAVTPFLAALYVIGVAALVAFWPLAWTTVRTGVVAQTEVEAEVEAEEPETGPEAEAETGPEAEEGEKPTAPRPRAAEEQKGRFRSLGRHGLRSHR